MELDTPTRNEHGQIIDRDGATGYRGHFTGAWICYTCGALCDCTDDETGEQ